VVCVPKSDRPNGGARAYAFQKLRVLERGAEGALLGFGFLRLGKFYHSAEAVAAAAAHADDTDTDTEEDDDDSDDDSDDDTGGGMPFMRKRRTLKANRVVRYALFFFGAWQVCAAAPTMPYDVTSDRGYSGCLK